MTTLRLEFTHADGTSASSANLPVEGVPLTPAPAAMAVGAPLTTQDGADVLRVSSDLQEIVFDKHTGTIRSWRVGGHNLLVGGPILNLGEAKAGNERGYFRSSQPPVTMGAQIISAPRPDGGGFRCMSSAASKTGLTVRLWEP